MTNSIPRRITAVVAVILALSSASSLAVASDQATYESLSDVSIGRVFFSPKQRKYLDGRRQGRPLRALRSSRPSIRPKDESAGFIVNSAGEKRIYSNGDFVAGHVKETVDFPGDVTVGRRTSSAPNATKVDDQAVESSDADD